MKNNREHRQEVLKQAGIDTNNFFSITFNEGLNPGTTIRVSIDQPEASKEIQNVREKVRSHIIEDGYVRNTKLHRRWIMAQMFKMLNYHSNRTGKYGYDAYLADNYSYHYQFTMMLEEVRVLAKLEARDYDSYEERSHFFSFDVIAATLKDYLTKFDAYIESISEKKFNNRKYKRLFNRDIFVDDIEDKMINPTHYMINQLIFDIERQTVKGSYSKLYVKLKVCIDKMFVLPDHTPKCKEWKDAFKGAGSYYTLMNMVKFHGCYVYNFHGTDYHKYDLMFGTEACYYLKKCLEKYKGNYYRMFALLKEVIKYNKFDFRYRMSQIYP